MSDFNQQFEIIIQEKKSLKRLKIKEINKTLQENQAQNHTHFFEVFKKLTHKKDTHTHAKHRSLS